MKAVCCAGKIRWLFASGVVLGFVTLFLASCAPSNLVINIDDKVELGDRKVLAGRIVCYRNGEPSDASKLGKWTFFFNRQGEESSMIVRPDEDGYIYVAVSEGQYNFARVATTYFSFNLDPIPTVLVSKENSIVNFGTLEFRFEQSTGAKVALYTTGFSKAYIKVNALADYDQTRSKIESVTRSIGRGVHDVEVVFRNRVR